MKVLSVGNIAQNRQKKEVTFGLTDQEIATITQKLARGALQIKKSAEAAEKRIGVGEPAIRPIYERLRRRHKAPLPDINKNRS